MTEKLPSPDRGRFRPTQDRDVRYVRAGTVVGRIYRAGGSHPASWYEFRHWGPTGARFDPHPEPEGPHPDHSVMYGAVAFPSGTGQVYPILKTCLAEVYRDRGEVDLRRDDPHFVLMTFTRDLRLLDLADSDWLTRVGGNAAISSGDRAQSRAWAREISAAYFDEVDGVVYSPSNVPPARAVALWQWAEPAVAVQPLSNLSLAHPGLRPAVEQFAYELGLAVVR
ncbi:RES family NAD+ phosphorylase [Dietzia cercidiphylli]|uniref:RES family NAD+ phosphorylase n=1 Tax=Dietzia cercidiphylli TaxID=498199 RepID=UPI003F81E51E